MVSVGSWSKSDSNIGAFVVISSSKLEIEVCEWHGEDDLVNALLPDAAMRRPTAVSGEETRMPLDVSAAMVTLTEGLAVCHCRRDV